MCLYFFHVKWSLTFATNPKVQGGKFLTSPFPIRIPHLDPKNISKIFQETYQKFPPFQKMFWIHLNPPKLRIFKKWSSQLSYFVSRCFRGFLDSQADKTIIKLRSKFSQNWMHRDGNSTKSTWSLGFQYRSKGGPHWNELQDGYPQAKSKRYSASLQDPWGFSMRTVYLPTFSTMKIN